MIRALLAALLLAGCATTPPAPPSPEESSVEGLTLPCAAGTETAALGGAVQVVEIWATWCQPCVRALPLWSQVAKEQGIEVLAVSIDDDREAAVRFADKHGIELPILWDPFGNTLARHVPLGGVVPTTLLTDCDGRVRHVHEGFDGGASIDDLVARARALQAESTCAPRRALPVCAP